jgi:hypothetical protein
MDFINATKTAFRASYKRKWFYFGGDFARKANAVRSVSEYFEVS